MFINYTILEANNKGADQTERMFRWSASLMFACSYARFSLDTIHKNDNVQDHHEMKLSGVIIIFQCFHTLASSVYWCHMQRVLLINASINFGRLNKIRVKSKMSRNEKKGHGGKHTLPKKWSSARRPPGPATTALSRVKHSTTEPPSSSVASDLGLHCLPTSHKKDTRFIWVKHVLL